MNDNFVEKKPLVISSFYTIFVEVNTIFTTMLCMFLYLVNYHYVCIEQFVLYHLIGRKGIN